VNTPRNQHTVSKAVLKQFSVRDKIAVFDRQRDLLLTTGRKSVFVFPDFIAHDPSTAERRWQTTETRMGKAYQLLRSGSPMDEATTETLRDLLAVHWTRSPATKLMHEVILGQVTQERRDLLARDPDHLRAAFVSRTGLEPTGPGALDWVNDEIHRLRHGVAEQFFSDTSARFYEQAKNVFSSSEIQVAHAPQRDLLIGDAPVVTTKPDHLGFGPHQGVPLGEATSIAMPIACDLLIALGPTPAQVTLSSEQVQMYNNMQTGSFVRWLGCRPEARQLAALRAATKPGREYTGPLAGGVAGCELG